MKLKLKLPLITREIRRQAREFAAQGKPLNVLLDIVFKAFLTADDEDSREALRLLLSACIHRPVKETKILNTEFLPEYLTGKTVRLDIHLTFNDGEKADLEMQVEKGDDDITVRAGVYAARLLSAQVRKGGHYREAKRVYQIFFLNFTLFPGSNKVPRRYFMMEEGEHTKLNEMVEIIFYEMPKLEAVVKSCLEGKRDLKTLSAEEKWCIFFKYKNNEKMQEMITELIDQEEGIMRADRALQKISRDEEQWARALFKEKAATDYSSGLYAAGKAG